jgi:hypothetical protein
MDQAIQPPLRPFHRAIKETLNPAVQGRPRTRLGEGTNLARPRRDPAILSRRPELEPGRSQETECCRGGGGEEGRRRGLCWLGAAAGGRSGGGGSE